MRRRAARGDAAALAALAVALAAVSALSWKRWGVPHFDGGYDPSVADVLSRGGELYTDVRYFYGPAGVYPLALAFKLFGASLTTAFVFGYAQTLAILGSFYALARTWLEPLSAGLTTLVLLTIAFSGTFFDFVLPHTDSATVGCLTLILQVLAVARGRLVLSGVAAGVLALTRPEFALFAAVVAAGTVLGCGRAGGVRAATRALGSVALPALAVCLPVLGFFASRAGFDSLVFDQLVPLDFIEVSGNRLQGGWAPYDVSSLVSSAARAALFAVPLAAVVACAVILRRKRGRAKLAALWPLVAALVGLSALAAAWQLLGVFPAARAEVTDEVERLLIAMSWLPVVVVAVAAWVALRTWRGDAPPAVGWKADLALAAGAAACVLRAYDRFSFDSYAPYYAPLPLLVAAIALGRVGERWPQAKLVPPAVLAAMAVALAAHAWVGLYRDDDATVHTERGSFSTDTETAAGLRGTLKALETMSGPDQTALVVPDSPGLHFLSGRRPALRDLTFLPGTLESAGDEQAAIRRLRSTRPPLVVVGAQRSDQYAAAEIGRDYNRLLLDYVRRHYRRVGQFGDVGRPTRNNLPARAFTVLELR